MGKLMGRLRMNKSQSFSKQIKLETQGLALNPNFVTNILPVSSEVIKPVGYINDVNLYTIYSENLDILSLFNYHQSDAILDDIDYQLIFRSIMKNLGSISLHMKHD